MNIKQIGILNFILLLTASVVFAQQPKVKPTPKPKAKTNKTKPATAKPTSEITKEQIDAIGEYAESIDFGGFKEEKAKEFFIKGQAFWKTLDIQEAIDAYTEAIKIYPNYADALRERGKIQFMIAKYPKAIADLNAFLKLKPNVTEIITYRGMAYAGLAAEILDSEMNRSLAEENAGNGLDDLNKVIGLEPKNVQAINSRGRLYLDFSLYKEAIADFKSVINLDKNYYPAYSNLGSALFYSGENTGFTEFEQAIKLYSGYAETYYNRGTVHRSFLNYDKAIEDFTKALKENGMNPKYYNARGMAYFGKGDGVNAVKDFDTATAQKPDFARAYLNRAITYKKFPMAAGGVVEQIDKMRDDLNAAIKYNPELADAYIERGKYVMGWLPVAINGYKEADLVKIRGAFDDYDKAVKLTPKNAEAYEGRASCNDSLGKKDSALADYNKAIELDPDLVTAYMGRMGIYCDQGKKELSILDEKKIKSLGYAAINVCNLGK